MTTVAEFATQQNVFNDRMDKAVAGIADDVKALADEILKIQSSPGTLSPEDQASLNTLQTRTENIATKLEALDALTPPAPPTEPPIAA